MDKLTKEQRRKNIMRTNRQEENLNFCWLKLFLHEDTTTEKTIKQYLENPI